MDGDQLKQACIDMSSNDIVLVNQAARKIINSAGDRELRTEFVNLVTEYQTAKDSVQMHAAFEKLIEHIKTQYASIYAQGFVMGTSFEQDNFRLLVHKAVQEDKAAKQVTVSVDSPVISTMTESDDKVEERDPDSPAA